jgi:hypothetical protein
LNASSTYPKGTPPVRSSAAALLDGLFEHPAGYSDHGATQNVSAMLFRIHPVLPQPARAFKKGGG